ncbi:hypothetical protein [Actinomyces howellii]|uniref:Leucine export protein LeuE n=1 Tax=Actinomyces howellii TaxID=52771 RepID=A0A3S4TBB2_9ACTO|nr:hypothetical protein [Actinomyces howellii]VEG29961.1 Uncharacterised protein [Actinomyces howellii]
MPTLEALAAFALASVILVVIPGPSVFFVIGRSLSDGRRGGLMSVLENGLGALPLVAAVQGHHLAQVVPTGLQDAEHVTLSPTTPVKVTYSGSR